ncbi:proline racemase family protein [Thalassotalea agarivorans]|uniref:trans-L-3-hydroxyproline dehydratase n=1 Tax=Thalassotalea agarivorans TaxID=349064 RepID=A0A1I0ACM6_THASX|nr:proline racemase family protein [Thalassotalea agarivorans]SES91967.1 proline racemase [Thalassotalea agarivorans]
MQLKNNNFKNYLSIGTIDAHTEGEPLRIITSGYPDIKGDTILEKRQYLLSHLDHLRQLLMFEPRGHADMYGALLTEPCTEQADFGILFMHNEGYSSMCGHGIIAAVSVAIESGSIAMPAPQQAIGIDSPAGLIRAYASEDETGKLQVSFDNVPSFVEALNQQVEVNELGTVEYDIAFGGAYYAYVDADKLGLSCAMDNQQALIDAGRAIKHAVMAQYPLQHPVEDDLSFFYGTIFYSSKTTKHSAHSRHVCIFADGEVDRSPTGTGVSGRAALLAVKEQLPENQAVEIESIVDGRMTVNIQQTTDFHGKSAVIPRVSGRAFVTGVHTFMLAQDDIFPQGFMLR